MEIKQNLTTQNFNVGTISRIKYIVVHYTGNNGDTALGNTNYFKQYRGSSAHYFVDENNVYQSIEDKNIAWHCGANTYYHSKCRNSNSIGVEMCSVKDSKGNFYFKEKTINNAIELIKMLMGKYSVPVENVVRHYDVTHKNCPAPFVKDVKAWENFKNNLIDVKKKKRDDDVVTETQININGKNYTVNRILKDNKNYIALVDFKQAGFDVGYNEKTKVPSFGVATNKQPILINGTQKEVNSIIKNDENYVRLRDLEEFFNIDYDVVDKKIKLSSKK